MGLWYDMPGEPLSSRDQLETLQDQLHAVYFQICTLKKLDGLAYNPKISPGIEQVVLPYMQVLYTPSACSLDPGQY